MKESIPLTWRRIPERYRLMGTTCETCGQHFFPSRSVCPKCRRKGKIKKVQYSGKGKIYSFTTIYSPPTGFEDQVPYTIAIIELDEGARVLGQIVDTPENKLKIGVRVEQCFRIIQRDDPEGLIHYGFKFRVSD
ncbi:MAG: Zn-ribbon domain-containing OB-fold protein [Candidatus Bilamarchaeaceae archaeon]